MLANSRLSTGPPTAQGEHDAPPFVNGQIGGLLRRGHRFQPWTELLRLGYVGLGEDGLPFARQLEGSSRWTSDRRPPGFPSGRWVARLEHLVRPQHQRYRDISRSPFPRRERTLEFFFDLGQRKPLRRCMTCRFILYPLDGRLVEPRQLLPKDNLDVKLPQVR